VEKLVLRNNRLDSAAWFLTAAVFAVAGLLALAGLIVANLRDPKALWMGPSVQSPQAIYLCLQGLALVVLLAMAALTLFKGKKFFDRSIQLTIDTAGIHDHRGGGQEIAWSEVSGITDWALYSGTIATATQLKVETTAGPAVGIDILGLDQDPKAILKAAKKIRKQVMRGS
jgi:hypothetical protein